MINTVEKIYDNNLFLNFKVTYNDGKISFVPNDTANRDYQDIQDWIADGNSVVDPNAE